MTFRILRAASVHSLPEQWCYTPYMHECDACKVTSPAECQRDSTHISQAGIAASLPQLKTFVAVHPDTIIAVGAIGFSNDFLKICLQGMKII